MKGRLEETFDVSSKKTLPFEKLAKKQKIVHFILFLAAAGTTDRRHNYLGVFVSRINSVPQPFLVTRSTIASYRNYHTPTA